MSGQRKEGHSVANLLDYLDWRGGASFLEEPLNGVDALCLAELSYPNVWQGAAEPDRLPLREAAQGSPAEHQDPRYRLVRGMAETRRFGDITACGYVSLFDRAIGIQFAALCFDLPEGTRAVSFRGTDGTIVGWREDFAMAYESPVPAQVAAAHYLEQVGTEAERLILTGHSKGGNLAAYAAVHAPEPVQARIAAVWSFDGPGLDDASLASDGFRAIRPRMHSVVPEASLVGLLLGQTSAPTVVHSTGTGLYQHDPFTWKLLPPGVWDEAEGTTLLSRVAELSLQEGMRRVSPERRRAVIEKAFRLVEASGAETTAELRARLKPGTLLALLGDIGLEKEINRVRMRIFGGNQNEHGNNGHS